MSCPVEKTTSSFIDSRSPGIVIAFGEAGPEAILTMTWNVPILSLFDGDEGHDSRVVPIDIPQPHKLQVGMLMKLNPDLKTIWYPYAGEEFKPASALEKAADEAGVRLVVNRLMDPEPFRSPSGSGRPDRRDDPAARPGADERCRDAADHARGVPLPVGGSRFLGRTREEGGAFAYVLTPERLAAWLDDVVTKYDSRSPVRKFENWGLILNATILDKLRPQPCRREERGGQGVLRNGAACHRFESGSW